MENYDSTFEQSRDSAIRNRIRELTLQTTGVILSSLVAWGVAHPETVQSTIENFSQLDTGSMTAPGTR